MVSFRGRIKKNTIPLPSKAREELANGTLVNVSAEECEE
jgi:hypothetical protein